MQRPHLELVLFLNGNGRKPRSTQILRIIKQYIHIYRISTYIHTQVNVYIQLYIYTHMLTHIHDITVPICKGHFASSCQSCSTTLWPVGGLVIGCSGEIFWQACRRYTLWYAFTQLWNITFLNRYLRYINYKWGFSIPLLIYQRVEICL